MRNLLLLFVFLSSTLSACLPSNQEQNVVSTSSPLPASTATATEYVPAVTESNPGTVNSATATSAVADVNVAATATLAPDFWKDLPIVPTGISERVREIYARGLAMGNDPNSFSKVGDCHSTNPYFLEDYDLGPDVYDLGEYAYLQPTIDYFKGSFARSSMATKKGLSTAGVLASLWSDWKYCSSNETPLDCEFRLHRPSFALISLGTNEAFDVKKDPSTFEGRLRRIIEHSIDQGVVPILSTKADNAEGNNYINYVTARLAMEYELPLWNFWKAVQPLPEQGLRNPEHLTFAMTKSYTDFSKPEYLNYGMQMRNLTALQTLDVIRREITGSPASAPATPTPAPATPPAQVYQPGETMQSGVDGMEMVYIPAGKFEMGSASGNPDQLPVHTVQLSGFWLDRTEVTNQMFVQFLNSNDDQQGKVALWLDTVDPFVWISEKDGVWQVRPGNENYPILNVSWYGAEAYCSWAGRELPTEAQWEYAAKSTENRRFPWGNDDPTCNLARFAGCGNSPVEVGSLLEGANLWGVLGLSGNVAEWTNDRYSADYYSQSPQENPPGPINGYYRVIRGGSWQSAYLPLQTSNRKWAGADEFTNSVGFRCAINP